jgi:hypothetical protein
MLRRVLSVVVEEAPTSLPPVRLVVVDDEAWLVELWTTWFSLRGISVVFGGSDPSQIPRDLVFDAALVDLGQVDDDGVEELRQRFSCAVVVITGAPELAGSEADLVVDKGTGVEGLVLVEQWLRGRV